MNIASLEVFIESGAVIRVNKLVQVLVQLACTRAHTHTPHISSS